MKLICTEFPFDQFLRKYVNTDDFFHAQFLQSLCIYIAWPTSDLSYALIVSLSLICLQSFVFVWADFI